MSLSPGTRLGSYEIIASVGAGGMGEVYRARDTRLGREVAVKVLPADVATHPERLARFEREAKTVAALNHPNIVVLHSLEEEKGFRFLTMELVEGESLDRLLAPGGMPLSRVLDLAIPLADALAAAHERGIVHRDLKPANVMVTREGRVKVLDFGLAKLADTGAAVEATRTMTVASPISTFGQVVGTVPYMAPEQLRGEPADSRSDLFALGIILFEMVTGRRPFSGASSAEVTSSILRDAPPPIASLRADLPPEVARIIARCLEKEPRQRPPSARDVREELESVRRTLASGLTSASRAELSRTSGSAAKEIPSIAVLPFVNRSRDEEDEYFAEGLADELLNVLAKIRGLRVAARTSSSQFKGKNDDVSVIGQKLHVATLLEGSVRKSGNRVRISVQLVKVAEGSPIWSETYDRTLEDIFAVQDDIAQAVVKELRATLLGEEQDSKASGEVKAEVAAAAIGRGTDPEAHRLFLQGRYLANRLADQDILTGIGHLREAVRKDPDHALAWACLAWAEGLSSATGTASPAEGNARARIAAERALALEPGLAEAHLALGVVQIWYDWNWKDGEASYRRALALAPDNAEVIRNVGIIDLCLCRLDEAMALCRRAIELDPLSVAGYAFVGRAYRAADRYPEAERAFRKAVEISPEGTGSRMLLSFVLEAQGRHDEALAEARLEKSDWARLYALAVVNQLAGRLEDADRALHELTATRAKDAAFQIAVAHSVRGDSDKAFEWLERAYVQRDSGCALMKPEPLFRSLHSDPRWDAFLRKMGLAD